MFPAIFIGGILLQYLQWYFHQWDVTHDFGLLSPLSYPPDTVRVLHDMFLSQTMNIRESQTGEATNHPNRIQVTTAASET